MHPDYASFLRYWNEGKSQTLSTVLVSDLETPVSAMLKLGQGKPFSFILESIEGGAVRGRYSIIGREPDLIWRCKSDGRAEINRHALENLGFFEPSNQPPLEDLRAIMRECQIDVPDQPQPISAGLFGYLGYDMIKYIENIRLNKPMGVDVPEAIMIRPTLLAIFDQIENKHALVTPIWFDKTISPERAYKEATTRLERAVEDLRIPLPTVKQGTSNKPNKISEPESNITEAGYIKNVEIAKEYIKAGDVFQVVLSQRFTDLFTSSPFALYRAIRRLDPSPFLYFFDFDSFSVVGSSPEILVRVRDNKITIRPIAGTRPRNMGNQTDKELEAELLADPKELAEHLMLLDLGRNDVGRMARMGTVKVTARNGIEYYKHVMHIVSNVEGELDPKYSVLDALIGGFPAGTVSGAPKVRAMEIIAELEPDRRGLYGGSVGYFGANGSMDTAIAIRTAIVKDGKIHIQAGAGIVYDSNPQAEYRECVAKAKGMIRAAIEAQRSEG